VVAFDNVMSGSGRWDTGAHFLSAGGARLPARGHPLEELPAGFVVDAISSPRMRNVVRAPDAGINRTAGGAMNALPALLATVVVPS